MFTLLDYFASGQRAVQDFLQSRPTSELDAVIQGSKRICARVDVRYGRQAEAYQSVMSSGVLIDGGRRVLTAGHALSNVHDYEVVITLPSGESRLARPLRREYERYGEADQDWAVLEILGAPFDDLPVVRLGQIRAGELVIILGYPDQIGIDAEGRVAHGSNDAGERLEPLVTLGTVEAEDRLILAPHAGSIPTGGMSGGPVFDSRGRLLGVFVSVVRADTEAGYTFRATPIRVLDHLLGQR